MSKETVKVTGAIKDRVMRLLGGANPTPKRLDALLEELEVRRETASPSAGEPVPSIATDDDDPLTRILETGPTLEETPEAVAAEVAYNEEEAEPDPPSAPPEVVESARDVELRLLREQNQLLMRHLGVIEKKLDAMAVSAEAARPGASLLPPPDAVAPPLGNTGPASWPIGEWFNSPLGPRVPYKLCSCERCTSGVLHHWYCVVCKGGPHHYQVVCREHGEGQRNPMYIKNHFAPGGIWGISHNTCSPLCTMQYMSMMGVVAGVNDAEPRAIPVPGQAPGPEDVRRPLDSD